MKKMNLKLPIILEFKKIKKNMIKIMVTIIIMTIKPIFKEGKITLSTMKMKEFKGILDTYFNVKTKTQLLHKINLKIFIFKFSILY